MPKRTFFNLPEEKREKIIEAAIEVFSLNHYKKVTIDKIVLVAEIPKGSYYQYFENKDDLYVFLFNQIGNKKKHKLAQSKKFVQALDFKTYILRLIEEGAKFESEDKTLLNLKNKFMNECPQEIRKEILQNEFPKSYDLLVEVIDLYIKKGELSEALDKDAVAYVLTQCTANLEFYRGSKDMTLEEVCESVLNAIIKGLK